jgi:hypothetical protein
MAGLQALKTRRPDAGAKALARAFGVMIGAAALGVMLAANASEAETSAEQMRDDCAKLHEDMKGDRADGEAAMDESSLSPAMKDMHRMCMKMMHGSGDHNHEEEARL